ncbi:pyridoxal phosphate-dependent enzyme beta subunit [Suillus subluteus]|nr:pyridoxal phosphate-dependent enzyme beta subunit [Suillus subluteus]
MESSPQRIDVQQTRESVTSNSAVNGFTGSVGNTPLIYLKTLSELTGCKIYGFQNPGDSVKDRAADVSRIKPGGTVVDGTAGNTGIGLAHVCRARGYECRRLLRMLGAENPLSYNHQAKEYAEKLESAIWIDQFENTANSSTGGTLAGGNSRTQIWFVDSPGSVLYEYVTSGGNLVERSLSSVTEEISQGRVTSNLGTFVDYLTGALHIWDEEAISMSYQLLDTESLYISASSALNSKVVTILCDGAHRYPSRLFSKKCLRKYAVLD